MSNGFMLSIMNIKARILIVILLLSVFCIPAPLSSQTIVEIGDGTGTSDYMPICMNSNYSIVQQIYTADEIGIAGTISSVGFYYDYNYPFSMPGIQMYMMHTAKDAFESGLVDVVAFDSASLVYEGDFAATEAGWLTLTLDTPFEYNGIDNLVICMYDTINGYLGNTYRFRTTSFQTLKMRCIKSNTEIPTIPYNHNCQSLASSVHNNIQLGIIPAPGQCFRPSYVVVNDITIHEAFVMWNAEEGESAWQICLNDNEDNLIDVTTNAYELTGLTSDTVYTVKIRVSCGNGLYSSWTRNVSFATLPVCPVPINFAVSNIGTTTATLTWDAGRDESAWQICLNDDESNLIDVDIDEYVFSNLTPGTNYSVKVRANCGENDGFGSWTDSKNLYTISICQTPTALTCIPSSTYATISWTAGADETHWNLKYKISSENNWTEVNGLTEPEHIITGLAPATAYIVSVQADCGLDGPSYWEQLSFNTKYAIPYLEEFPTSNIPADWSRYYGRLSDVMNNAQNLVTTNSSSAWSFGYSNGVFDRHGFVYVYGPSCKYWLVTPVIVMDDNVELKFDLALTKTSGTLQPVDINLQTDYKFAVLISTDDGVTWTILRQFDNVGSEYVYNNIATAGEEVTICLADYSTDHIKIAFYTESTIYDGYNILHIDNVRLNYIKPQNLTVSNLTTTTADVQWACECCNTEWDIKYGISGFDVETEGTLVENIAHTSYSITGLLPNTNYDVYVKATGGNNNEYEWVMTSFRTDCGIFDIPYNETFDDIIFSTSNMTIPRCWLRIVENAMSSYVVYPHVVGQSLYSNTSHSGSQSICFHTTGTNPQNIIALPQMSDINTLMISFWAKYDDSIPEVLQIGYVANGEFVSIEPFVLTTNYRQYVAFLDVASVDAERIAFLMQDDTGNSYVYVDDIEVIPILSCPNPINLEVSNITSTSAVVSWTPTGNETAWQYTLDDGITWNNFANTPTGTATMSVTITGLTANTEYIVKVRAYCSDSEQSEASSDVAFYTAICAPDEMCEISYTLSDRFSDGWNNAAINVVDVERGIVLAELTMDTGISSTTGTLQVCNGREISFVWSSGSFDNECSYAIYDVNGDEILSGTGAMTTMNYIVDCNCFHPSAIRVSRNTGYEATIRWTAGGDETAWQLCINDNDDNIIEVTEPLYEMTDLVPATEYTIKIRSICGNGIYSNWTMPFSFFTACPAPTNLRFSNIGMTSATVTWDVGSDENMWQIALNGNQDNIIDVYDNEYTFTELERGTRYSVVVWALCDENRRSSWLVGSFNTLAGCPSPDNLTASIIDTTYAVLTWSPSVDATSWQICVNYDFDHIIDVYDTTYTLTNLTEGTRYEIMVRTNCGSVQGEFNWSFVEFTTLADCYAPYYVDIDVSAAANSANISWPGTSDGYVIRYRTAEINGSYFTDFENGIPDDGWETIDNDGDMCSWVLSTNGHMNCHSGIGCMTSWSHVKENNVPVEPDNWLISPQLALNGTFKVWICAQNPSLPDEHFGIYVSTTGRSVTDFATQVLPETVATAEYQEYTVDLSSYNWQLGYIAIRHYNSIDMYRLNVDDYEIDGEDVPAGEWIEVETTEPHVEINGLEQGVEYEVQIMGVCGENHSIWSHSILLQTLSITATAGEHGAISPSGIITFNRGEDQTFSIIPDEGYRIENVLVDGFSVMENIENNTYTFTNIIGDHTIHVTFESLVSVDMTEEPSMSIFPNPNNGTYNIVFGNISGSVTYQLYDVRGAMVETRDVSVTNDEPVIFNHILTPGSYFVRIIVDDKVFVEKVVVE